MLRSEPSRNPKKRPSNKWGIWEYLIAIGMTFWGLLFVNDVMQGNVWQPVIDLLFTATSAASLDREIKIRKGEFSV